MLKIKNYFKNTNAIKGYVLSVKIRDNYFLSGGMDGKIFLYSVPLKKMVSKIAKYKDFISTVDLDEEIERLKSDIK